MANPPDIRISTVEQTPLAVVKETAHAGNIGERIGQAIGKVYERLDQLQVGKPGQNVVVYYPHRDGNWMEPPGIPIEVGVQLSVPFDHGSAPVEPSSTPAGRVATALHIGPYQELPQTHQAIHAWCRAQGLAMTGLNWEVYGDHVDDPSKLRTDVYYQLR